MQTLVSFSLNKRLTQKKKKKKKEANSGKKDIKQEEESPRGTRTSRGKPEYPTLHRVISSADKLRTCHIK